MSISSESVDIGDLRAPLTSGSTLQNGRYTIVGLLGTGGSALTYRAKEGRLGLEVCIKEYFPVGAIRAQDGIRPLAPEFEHRVQDGLAAFVDEAQTLARFSHPGVVRVLGQFDENGTTYLVQEVLVGMTLSEVLGISGKMKEEAVMKIAQQVGQALLMVHGAGLVHSDLKPANLFLTREGRYVLLDFGLTRGFLSRAGAMKGARGLTPGFAPPEQYSENQKLTPAADVYAFAATLYTLYANMPPTDSLLRAQGEPLAAIKPLSPTISLRAERALNDGLELDVRKRTPGVREFLTQLGLETSPKFVSYKPPTFTRKAKVRAHPGGVTAMTLDVPAQRIYSGGKDGFIRAWSWPDLQALGALQAHAGPVSALAMNRQGSLLVSGSEGGEIKLWVTADGQGRPLWNEGSAVTCLAFAGPDSIVATFASGTAALLEPGRAQPLRWGAHAGAANSIDVHPNGVLLVSAGDDCVLRFWTLPDGQMVRQIPAHEKFIQQALFSPDGGYLVSVSNDHSAFFWDLATAEVIRDLKGHGSVVLQAAFSCRPKLVLTVAGDRFLRGFSLDSGRVCLQVEANGNSLKKVVSHPQQPLVGTGGGDGELAIWEFAFDE